MPCRLLSGRGGGQRRTGLSRWVLGWPKIPFSFFCKIKDTFFIFTKNFTDLDILSYVGYLPLLAPGGWRPEVLLNIFQCIIQPTAKELFGQNVNSTKKLCKPLLTCSISHSTFSIHCTNLFLHFSCITFLAIKKHNTPKMLHILFHL